MLLASLDPLKVKLADFGISKSTAGTDLRTRIGTTHYMAPEQLGLLPLSLRMGVEYTTAVDMWALGFIVHELLTGQTPFLETPVDCMSSGHPTVDPGAASIDIRLMLQFYDGNSDLLRDTDPAAVSFIATLVVPDPRARASAAQAMLHPWIIGRASPLLPEPLLAPEILTYDNGRYVLPAYYLWREVPSAGVLQASQGYPVERLVNPPGAPTEQGRQVKFNGFPMGFGRRVAPSAKPWSDPAGVGFAAQAGASPSRPYRTPMDYSASDSWAWRGQAPSPELRPSSTIHFPGDEGFGRRAQIPQSRSDIGQMDLGIGVQSAPWYRELPPPRTPNYNRPRSNSNASTSGSIGRHPAAGQRRSSIDIDIASPMARLVLPADEPADNIPYSISRYVSE